MIWLVRADWKRLIRGKWKKGCLFLLLLAAFAGISFHVLHQEKEETASGRICLGIVNYDTSEYSELLLQFFNDSEAFQKYVEIVYGTEEELEELLMQNKLQMILIVPENFIQNMIAIENTPLRVLLNTSDKTKALLMKNLLEGYERFISAVEINCVTLYEVMQLDGLDQELIENKNIEISLKLITTVVNKNDLFLHLELENLKRVPLVLFYCNVFILLFTMFLAAGCGSRIIEEKRDGIFSRLLTAGVKPTVYFLEKLLFYTGIASLPGLVSYLIAVLLSKEPLPLAGFLLWITAALFFCAFALFFSSWFQGLQGYLLASNLIFFFLTVLGGGIIPFMYLPESMTQIAEKTPFYWIVLQIDQMLLGVLPEQLFSLLAVCLAGAGIFFLASSLGQQRKGGIRHEEL